MRKTFELMFLNDLCLILGHLVGKDWKILAKKYKTVGYSAVLGAIIAEIHYKKARGDNLRERIARLEKEMENLRQLDLFISPK